jgi:hypothetical protein
VHSVQEHAEEGEVSVVAAVGDAVDALHELDPSSPLYRTAEVLGGDPCIKHEGGRYEALSWLGTRSLVCPKPPMQRVENTRQALLRRCAVVDGDST